MKRGIGRRDALVGGAIATLAGCGERTDVPAPISGAPPLPPGSPSPPPGPIAETPKPGPKLPGGPLPTRAFGNTGVKVTILGLGGGHGITDVPERAVPLVERAYQQGIRFFDAAPIYNHCQANYGEALQSRRAEVFLQTKTLARDRDGALRDLEASLKAMRTDHLDSWLFHDVRHDQDVDAILGPGGALEAFTKAVDEKMVRFIGASCHSFPLTLKRLIEAHPLDCTTMSLNAAEGYDKPFAPTVLPVAVEKNMGIVAIKVMGYSHILKAITAKEAFDWALSQPVSMAIVGVFTETDIDSNADIARAFRPLSAAEQASIVDRASAVAHAATFFRRDEWAA